MTGDKAYGAPPCHCFLTSFFGQRIAMAFHYVCAWSFCMDAYLKQSRLRGIFSFELFTEQVDYQII